MNCHHARQLISPYLDQRLTGREMLALQGHFGGCVSCQREMQSIRQVKALLRGLREPGPPRNFSQAVALRLEQAEGQSRRLLWLPSISLRKPAGGLPQRGRRLAGALVLSCFTVVSFALPFAPEARQAARSSSAMFGPGLGSPGSSPFGAASEADALLSGRVPERVTLTPIADLTHFSSAEASAPGTLTLTGMNMPPITSGMEPAPHDAPFGPAQFADFRSR